MVNDRFGWKTKNRDSDLGIYEQRFASVTLEKHNNMYRLPRPKVTWSFLSLYTKLEPSPSHAIVVSPRMGANIGIKIFFFSRETCAVKLSISCSPRKTTVTCSQFNLRMYSLEKKICRARCRSQKLLLHNKSV